MHLCENITPSFARFGFEPTPFTIQKATQVTTSTKFFARAKFQMGSDGFKQVPTTLFSHLWRDFICKAQQADVKLFCHLKGQPFSALQLTEEKIW